MNKEFISYEQALALKELGFDEPCQGYYDVDKGYSIGYAFCYSDRESQPEDGCLAPLYQQAFRWFREKYDLIGLVEGGYDNGKNIFTYVIWDKFKDNSIDVYYQTYEEAELECLIKLIETVKSK